jgi:hypothetical protein
MRAGAAVVYVADDMQMVEIQPPDRARDIDDEIIRRSVSIMEPMIRA